MFNFPPSISEDLKLEICKLLDDKDKELSAAYKEIVVLENKLERYNGGWKYNEVEVHKTNVAILQWEIQALAEQLKKRHLKPVKYTDKSSSHVFEIKLERITYWTRFKEFIKLLIPFKIVKN